MCFLKRVLSMPPTPLDPLLFGRTATCMFMFIPKEVPSLLLGRKLQVSSLSPARQLLFPSQTSHSGK